MTDGAQQFRNAKYMSLETFRKSGEGVPTPVWFAESFDGRYFIYTVEGSGKIKRIRNNSRVRVAPCSIRGKIQGTWVEATAAIVVGEEARLGQRLLNRKYWLKVIGNLFSSLLKRQRAVIAVSLR